MNKDYSPAEKTDEVDQSAPVTTDEVHRSAPATSGEVDHSATATTDEVPEKDSHQVEIVIDNILKGIFFRNLVGRNSYFSHLRFIIFLNDLLCFL